MKRFLTVFLFVATSIAVAQPAPYQNWGGVNQFTGWLDATMAGHSMPFRTGTGSPVSRDACIRTGEPYFQTDAAAGQNVFFCTAAGTPGTWFQTNVLFAGATGALNPKTATYQVTASDFANLSVIPVASGTFTITLVASTAQPAAGQYITISNYGTGTVTVARSGQNINGATTSLSLPPATSGQKPISVQVWSDGTNYFASGIAGVPASLPATTSVNSTTIPASATLATGPGTSTAHDLTAFADTGGATTEDSGILTANVVTAASAAGAAKQVCTASGASKSCSYIDFPESKFFGSATCNNATATGLWSTPASGVTAACRGGTNNKIGVLQFAASGAAQLAIHLPLDWDTATNPYLSIDFTQGASTTTGQTIIMQAQVACGVTDDTAFNTAQAFATATSTATAHTEFTKTVQLNSTSMTNCVAGSWMNLQIVRSGSDTATTAPNVYGVTVTIPRLLTVQAN